MKNKKILKEYIRSIINEDDLGGLGLGDMSSPYGMDYTGGDNNKLYKVFVKPFTDVVSTAAGKGKEVSTKVQTLGRVAFEAIATTLIPALSSDYDQIFRRDEDNIEKLQAQYKDIYDGTWTAFKDNDVLAAAFAYAPTQMISLTFLKKAPIPVLRTLNVLAGGKFDDWISKVKRALNRDEKKVLDNDTGPGVDESILREASGTEEAITKAYKKMKSMASDNPEVQRMQNSARESVRQTLEDVYDQAQTVMRATSLAALGKVGKVANTDEIKKLATLPPRQRKAVEASILKAVKASAKKLYRSKIEQRISSALKAGVAEDHPYVHDHKMALNKLNSL